jgi:hypothetical protein
MSKRKQKTEPKEEEFVAESATEDLAGEEQPMEDKPASVVENDLEAEGTSEDTPLDQDANTEVEAISDNSVDESEGVTDETEEVDESVAVKASALTKIKRFVKSFRVLSLKKSKNLLTGPCLFVSYTSGDIHMTVILRSVSWLDQEYLDAFCSFLRAEHPTLDLKILDDADFGDRTQPDASVKLVKQPFHPTVAKAIDMINGWKWVPHITFPSGMAIPDTIVGATLETKLSYPNWQFQFDGSLRAKDSRMATRLGIYPK